MDTLDPQTLTALAPVIIAIGTAAAAIISAWRRKY